MPAQKAIPRKAPDQAALGIGRWPRMARKKNSSTNGAHTAPLSICGQLLVPTNPAIPKARPEIIEAARERFRSRQSQ